MQSDSLNIDERRGLAVSSITALLLLLFSIWYSIDLDQGMRPSFIEVEFGEFQSGQLSEFSEQQNEQVATRQNPSKTPTEEPVEDAPEPENTPETSALENTKPVDLPDEIEEIIEQAVQTPDTEILDPSQNASEVAEEEIEIPTQSQMDEDQSDGAEESGDSDGNRGATDSDQGSGTDTDETAPYELKWEGDIERAPMVQPLPTNVANAEAVITVRFEVRPNGTVGRIIPLRKMNAELETEVLRTLRSWRFRVYLVVYLSKRSGEPLPFDSYLVSSISSTRKYTIIQ